ncbi:MAG: hypothetical protein ACP5US_12580 [Candidatus Kryptoniota bacterium]
MKKRDRLVINPGDKATSRESVDNLLLFPVSTEPSELEPPVRIRLTVSGKSAAKKKIEGYLTKYFKSLETVTITDYEPHYWISVIGMVDNRVGYNISYFIAGLYPSLKENLSEGLDESEAEMMSDLLDGLCSVFEHRIEVGPPEKLQSCCAKIVKDFDENFAQEFMIVQKTLRNESEL